MPITAFGVTACIVLAWIFGPALLMVVIGTLIGNKTKDKK